MSEEIQDPIATEDPIPDSSDAEARAGRQGWVPKDEWKGNPDQWRDADAFNLVGERENGVLKERNAALDTRLQEMTATLGEAKSTLQEFKGHHEKVANREYQRALRDIHAKQREAVKEGDVEAYDAAANEAAQVRKDAVAAAPKKPATTAQPSQDPEFVKWKGENDWFDSDVQMTIYADQAAPIVARTNPTLRGRAFYEKVAEEVKRAHPDKFDNPRRRQAAAVGGTGDTVHRKGGKTFADLPPDAKDAANKFAKQGLITKEQYVKEYEWE